MATTIITKNGSGAPADGDLSVGELAVDLTNKQLYTKNSGGVIKLGGSGNSGEWEVNGSDIYYDTGNVGIGDSNPSVPLSVNGASRAGRNTGQYIELSGDSSSNRISVVGASPKPLVISHDTTAGGSSTQFRTLTGNDFIWQHSTDGGSINERMRIESDGDVRLGYYTNFGSASSLLDLTFVNTNNTEHEAINFQSDNAAGRCFINYERGASSGRGDLIFGASNAERARITWEGNLLVGTTSPVRKLTVEDSAQVVQYLKSTNAGNACYIEFNNAGSGSNVCRVGSGGGSLLFASGNGTTKATLDSSGNVGIGNTDPTGATAGSGYRHLDIKSAAGDTGGSLRLTNSDESSVFRIFNSDTVGTRLGTYSNNTLDIYTNSSQVARFDTSGNLLVGTTAASGNGRLVVKGSGTGTSTHSIYALNSANAATFTVRDDGQVYTGTSSKSPYNNTTATASNVVVNTSGVLLRSTSSARYKENIRDYDQTASIDSLRPVFFNSKDEGDDKTYAGLIAEEVHEAGFTEFVEYNEAGEPDAVFYANMVALCIKEIQDLKAEVAALKGA